MLKICKYGIRPRKFVQLEHLRFSGNKCDPCRPPCPPSYVCKRPPKDPEFESWLALYQNYTHPFLRCKKPKDYKPYKNMTLFLCLPICMCMFFSVKYIQPPIKRPKFVAFEYMRIRRKPLPWDPQRGRSLFHNPYYNALPDGYEFEVPEEEEFDPRVERCKPK